MAQEIMRDYPSMMANLRISAVVRPLQEDKTEQTKPLLRTLLLRSFEKMRSVDLGYRPEHVTTASYSLPQKQYEKQSQIDEFNRELLRRLNASPGVSATGLASLLPAEGSVNNTTFVVDGYKPPKGASMNLATATQVIGNFFPTMGIPLLRGRFFTEGDRHGSQLVIIVNHGLAEHFWPGQDPI